MLNKRGYSLLELMIAAAIVVVAMLAFATMITQQRHSHMRVRQTVEASAVVTRIEQFLSHSSTCEQNLAGLNPNASGDLTELKDTAGNPAFWTDDTARPRQEFAGLLFVDHIKREPGPVSIAANSTGIIRLETTFGRITSTQAGVLRPRTSLLFVQTDNSGRIKSCSTKVLNNFNCRVVTDTGSREATAVCDQIGEQVMGCGFEDNDLSGNHTNYMIPTLPGAGAPAPVAVYIAASGDAYVSSASPTANFGSVPLRVSSGSTIEETYLQFDLSELESSVGSALLRVYVTNGSADGPRLVSVPGAFTEAGITFDSKPPATGTVFRDFGAVSAGAWIDYDLGSHITGPGIYNFALIGGSTDRVELASREDPVNPPHLYFSYQPAAGVAGRGECRCFDAASGTLRCHALCCKW